MPEPVVIGLTGSNAAGKGEVAAYLASRGFECHSLSDVVRAEADRRGLPHERRHLIEIGNDLRRQSGPGALAEFILPALGPRAVVDSVRNPAEVEILRSLPRFVLAGVRAAVAQRFGRALERARPGDPETLEEFEERERQENTADPAAQQLAATLKMADVFVDNAGTLADLKKTLDRLVDRLDAPATDLPRG